MTIDAGSRDAKAGDGRAPVNLLWTSGWDSTFRLLMLVFEERRAVQPYYVVDKVRAAWTIELQTQEKIRASIAERDPAAAELILPTVVVEKDSIPEHPEISESQRRLADARWIGGQYEFLPRMARHLELSDIELSVHVDDLFAAHLEGNVELVDGRYRLKPNPSSPDLEIFRSFSFPILTLAKLEMGRIARGKGFEDILELTWFCHSPRSGRRPCGRCGPCNYVIEEGLARRVPLESRIRRRLAPVKALLMRMIPGARTRTDQ